MYGNWLLADYRGMISDGKTSHQDLDLRGSHEKTEDRMEGYYCCWRSVSRGVLGPLLFVIYINVLHVNIDGVSW